MFSETATLDFSFYDWRCLLSKKASCTLLIAAQTQVEWPIILSMFRAIAAFFVMGQVIVRDKPMPLQNLKSTHHPLVGNQCDFASWWLSTVFLSLLAQITFVKQNANIMNLGVVNQ